MCKSDTCKTATNHPARRQFIRMAGVSALGVAASGASLTSFAATPDTRPLPKPLNAMSPDAAISRLKEGNARYVAGLMLRHDFAHERESLGTGQNPYAAVLSCADSRIAPEYAFDSARGDLFAVRVAGNFVNDDVLGSLEYAVAVLKNPGDPRARPRQVRRSERRRQYRDQRNHLPRKDPGPGDGHVAVRQTSAAGRRRTAGCCDCAERQRLRSPSVRTLDHHFRRKAGSKAENHRRHLSTGDGSRRFHRLTVRCRSPGRH